MFAKLVCMSLLLAAGAGEGPKQSYPRADLLIEASELNKKIKDFCIVDARPRGKYDQGHIPGAVSVDHDAWSKSFAAGQGEKSWAAKIGELGIGTESRVVVYDDGKAKEAARVWWILRYFGVKDARLLNGGWSAWKEAGLPISTEAGQAKPGGFAVTATEGGRLATRQSVMKLLKEPQKTQIIDSRSEAEHCGIEKLAKRGGAIPGSIHLEWSEALDPRTHKFKSPQELTRLLKDAGIDVTHPAVTYCQSGGRAAVMAFTLELMGARDVANYYRSWSEWGNAADTPVEQPKKK
jgi:thiosulfate/3-mercaptopyruvate sulfurtransferase